jgi:type IV pilus assembly protein PilX
MCIKPKSKIPVTIPAQQGMVLIVGLIMVLLITIIGLAAIRGSGLQESMAGNMRDRNIAFQAAESALREGEAILSAATLPEFGCVDGSGTCLDLSSSPQNSVIYWAASNWTKTAKETVLDFDDVTSPPRYVAEELEVDVGASAAAEGSAIDVGGMLSTGDATPYRVTAKGFGISADTEVIVQSSYKRRYQ